MWFISAEKGTTKIDYFGQKNENILHSGVIKNLKREWGKGKNMMKSKKFVTWKEEKTFWYIT